jgi:hypothetical protein
MSQRPASVVSNAGPILIGREDKAMRAYLATTGILFVLLTVAHIVRAFQETHLVREPWFWLVTVVPCVFAVWALRLFRATARP